MIAAGLQGLVTATLTATSADDGCGGRVARVFVGRAEGVAQGVDGLALEALSQEPKSS